MGVTAFMRYLFFKICFGVLILIGLLALSKWSIDKFTFKTNDISKAEISVKPLVKELKKIGTLYVLKLHVGFFDKNEKTHGDEKSFYWQRVRGHAFYSIDLNKLKVVSVDKSEKIIEFEIDMPSVNAPTVDNSENGTVLYEAEYCSGKDGKIDQEILTTESSKRAQAEIEKRVSNPKYIKMAQVQVEEMFKTLFLPMGYKTKIVWQ